MASAGEGEFLVQAATYLGAAAIAIPVFQRLKLGSILGYLAAGVVVGPFGLNLLHQEEGVFHVAELGVVLFLFVIGLELSLSRLWSMRAQIFGFGAAQMALTGTAIASLFVIAEVMPAPAAIIAGLSLAFSSTAFALQLMKERGELNTSYGQRAFSILLFQDLAVIPLLAAIPFVAGAASDAAGWTSAGKAVGVLVALLLIGRFALDKIFRLVASAGSREAFAAMALFVVAITSLAVAWAGLSMALGAFLAGALLAESSYRHQIETDIEPFRGLLLGLFFISIGMRLDLGVIAQSWWIVLGGAVGLVVIKSVLIFVVTRISKVETGDAVKISAVLSQGGEFAFVVISLGVSALLFTNAQATLLSAIVTISMVMTPVLSMLAARITLQPNDEDHDDLARPQISHDHVIVAGFGRMGQIISQVLQNSGVQVTAIDRNPAHIRNAERFGFKVYYGDGARLDILLTAGAENARAVILCMDDRAAVNHAVKVLRERLPKLTILAVAHDRLHEIDLQPLGADVVVRETLESSLLIARETLERLGFDDPTIDDFVEQFRKVDRERLLAQRDYGPEAGSEFLHSRYQSPKKPT